jgi:hypothetical protein
MRGEHDETTTANRRPQQGLLIVAWIGIALATYLVVVLVSVLTDTPTLGTMGGLFVILLAMGGYSGSQIRNRKRWGEAPGS